MLRFDAERELVMRCSSITVGKTQSMNYRDGDDHQVDDTLTTQAHHTFAP